MALLDWNIYKTPSGLSAIIDPGSPVLGSGSLLLKNTGFGGSLNVTSLVALSDSLYTPGLLKGRMRQVVNITSANRTRAGFSFMHSHADISPSTGRAWYEAIALADFSGSQRRWGISRYTNGFFSGTTLFSSGTPVWSFSTTFTMEVEWNYDLADLGGLRITLRVGTATDFSDLAVVYNTIDTSGLITTSLGEGPYVLKWDTFGDTYTVRYDNTSIYTLS
jgi:hypothetical protein